MASAPLMRLWLIASTSSPMVTYYHYPKVLTSRDYMAKVTLRPILLARRYSHLTARAYSLCRASSLGAAFCSTLRGLWC